MGRLGFERGEGSEPPAGLREMRRSYHDRIAEVRERSISIIRSSVGGTRAATLRLVAGGEPAGDDGPPDAAAAQAVAAGVDAEVVSLLALESPMARDLRVILASRDVTQIGLLCIGLCRTLDARVARAADALTPELSRLVGAVGAGTERLLAVAESAWAILDTEMASEVERAAVEVRAVQTEFMTALLDLGGVPMDAALDLAMVARAFERLTDHAVEVAERVRFAVSGAPAAPDGS